MTQRHYNPLEHTHLREVESPGEDYTRHIVEVTEIREKSIFIRVNAMTVQPMGRSLLHAASDDMITKYTGPLPAELRLSIKTWWLERYGFIKD